MQALNVSGRVFVQTGDKVAICGFIINGGTGKRLLLRGLGPTLQNANPPLPGALQNPIIELYDGNGAFLTSNDDWQGPQQNEIQQTGLAPSDAREAALIATLAAGNYTAILRGAGNTAGLGLLELYDLDPGDGQFANVSVRAEVLTGERVLITGPAAWRRPATPPLCAARMLRPESPWPTPTNFRTRPRPG